MSDHPQQPHHGVDPPRRCPEPPHLPSRRRPVLSLPRTAARSRRGFLGAAGFTLAAALGLSHAAGPAATAAAPDDLRGVRLRTFHALVEALVSTRRGDDTPAAAGRATDRFAGWYAQATAERCRRIDDALAAVEDGLAPGSFARQDVRARLATLADQLAGRAEERVVTAIGLAAGALSNAYATLDDAHSAGRLHARMIRAIPAQSGPGRTPLARPRQQTASPGARPMCAP